MKPCHKKPYPWNSRKVAKSPFRNLSKAKKSIKNIKGFTQRSSLKSMGRIPRSTGCYELGQKYR